MNTFMHGPSFYSLHFLSFLIYFPKLTIFTISRLYMTCKMWKITTELTWEMLSGTLVEKLYMSAFSMYYFPYNWIGEHEITKLKNRYICFESRKRTQKQAQNDINKIEWLKMDHLIFSAMRMLKRHLFCTSSHHNKRLTRVWELNWMSL